MTITQERLVSESSPPLTAVQALIEEMQSSSFFSARKDDLLAWEKEFVKKNPDDQAKAICFLLCAFIYPANTRSIEEKWKRILTGLMAQGMDCETFINQFIEVVIKKKAYDAKMDRLQAVIGEAANQLVASANVINSTQEESFSQQQNTLLTLNAARIQLDKECKEKLKELKKKTDERMLALQGLTK